LLFLTCGTLVSDQYRLSHHFMSVFWAGSLPLKQSSLCIHRPANLVTALTIDFDGMEVDISHSRFLPFSRMAHGSEGVSANGIEAFRKDAPLASYHHLPPITHYATTLLHPFRHHPSRRTVSLHEQLDHTTRLPLDCLLQPLPRSHGRQHLRRPRRIRARIVLVGFGEIYGSGGRRIEE
jgi:hypothetical protein